MDSNRLYIEKQDTTKQDVGITSNQVFFVKSSGKNIGTFHVRKFMKLNKK